MMTMLSMIMKILLLLILKMKKVVPTGERRMKKRAEEEGRTPKQASVPLKVGVSGDEWGSVVMRHNRGLSDPGREAASSH